MKPRSKKQKLLFEMPVLYQNKRTAILDCSENLTYGLEEYSILMWDKFLNLEMGWGKQLEDGSFQGFVMYGPHAPEVSGVNIVDFAVSTLSYHKWTLEH
jgi:hypothetical protein